MIRRRRICIVISRSGIAVVSRTGRRENIVSASLGSNASLADGLRDAIQHVRAGTRCSVVFGPSLAQVRRVTDLPGALTEDMAHRILSQSPERFFVGHADDIAVVGTEIDANGAVWGWSVDSMTFGCVEAALRAARIRADFWLPATTLLLRRNDLLEHGAVVQDGHVAAVSSVDDDGIVTEGREWFDESRPLDLVDCATRALDDCGRGFLAAPTLRARVRQRDISLLRVGAFASILGLVFVLGAPFAAGYREIAMLSATLDSFGRQRRVALEIDSLVDDLHAVGAVEHRLRSSRLPILRGLAAVSVSIGEAGRLRSFHVDSSGVDVTAQVGDAVEYLDALDSTAAFASIGIVGSISSIASSQARSGPPEPGGASTERAPDRVSVHLTVAPPSTHQVSGRNAPARTARTEGNLTAVARTP